MSTLSVVTGDITTQDVDAIVNAANTSLQGGGGVDGAIHAAGGPEILAECREWVDRNGRLPTGQAMATGGGRLKAAHVIHTVGPIWSEHEPAQAASLLGDCYLNSLALANEMGCKSIAFPNISTGIYGFPKVSAAEIAVPTVRKWVETQSTPATLVFVCFDDENFRIYETLLTD